MDLLPTVKFILIHEESNLNLGFSSPSYTNDMFIVSQYNLSRS